MIYTFICLYMLAGGFLWAVYPDKQECDLRELIRDVFLWPFVYGRIPRE